MKKEDVASIIVYVIIITAAIIFGITVLQPRAVETTLSQTQYIWSIVLFIVLGVVANAIIFELAHILGAKLGRYNIETVNILGFTFYKGNNNKFKFKFSSPNGLTGEVKISPKTNVSKEPNPRPYLMFGTLFYLIELIIVISVYILLEKTNRDLSYFVLIVGFIGGMIFVYNIIPLKLDSLTDGYRLTLISNPKNKVAFNELLRVEKEIENGNKDVEIKTFDQITNFTAELNLNKAYLSLDKGEYESALGIVDQIINAKGQVSEKVYIRAVAQKVFIYMVSYSLDEAKEKIEKEISHQDQREISLDTSMVSARAYILLAGLIDKSKSEVERTIFDIQKAFRRTNKNRREIEIKLFNIALDKVIEAHPSWGFEKYHLTAE